MNNKKSQSANWLKSNIYNSIITQKGVYMKYKVKSTMLDGTCVENAESYLLKRTEDNKYLFDAYVETVYEVSK